MKFKIHISITYAETDTSYETSRKYTFHPCTYAYNLNQNEQFMELITEKSEFMFMKQKNEKKRRFHMTVVQFHYQWYIS